MFEIPKKKCEYLNQWFWLQITDQAAKEPIQGQMSCKHGKTMKFDIQCTSEAAIWFYPSFIPQVL